MDNLDELFGEVQSRQKETVLQPFDKEAWASQKQKERADAYALIDSTAEKMKCTGELFQTFLDVQARFDRYSVGNAILITAQKPDATRLADFDKWKEAGAFVNKGAVGITVLEPGSEYAREDGSTGVSYNAKKVFDISQTNSKADPALTVTRDERLMLKALISNAPCEMKVSENLSEHLNALYKPDEKTILVRKGMDGPSIFRAISQELAHARMDGGDYRRSECANAAYCVSYILCKRCGVSTDGMFFRQMPEQYTKMDTKDFRAELGKIRSIANEITAEINRVLENEKREKKGEAR